MLAGLIASLAIAVSHAFADMADVTDAELYVDGAVREGGGPAVAAECDALAHLGRSTAAVAAEARGTCVGKSSSE